MATWCLIVHFRGGKGTKCWLDNKRGFPRFARARGARFARSGSTPSFKRVLMLFQYPAFEGVSQRTVENSGSEEPATDLKNIRYHGRTSLSDVAEMNTVTWGPESSPTTPHRTHKSEASIFDHHVERGTNVVTRSARRRDWEGLSGRRQFPSKHSLAPFKEDGLLTI